MHNIETPILKVDPEFKKMILPLCDSERKELEHSILAEGCREPISVWYTTIIDGHNRYEICTRNQIPFQTQKIFFKNREEVIVWICTKQLERKNISEMTRWYLIGKRYEMEKILGAHNAAGTNQYKERKDRGARSRIVTETQYEKGIYRTQERLGKEYRLSTATINRYGVYAKTIDMLWRVIPELAPMLFSGQLKITQDRVIALAALPPQEIRSRCSGLLNGQDEVPYSASRQLKLDRGMRAEKPSAVTTATIKDMPAYDPDAEIQSLTLTIPSWISSIERTCATAKFSEASSKARGCLEKELHELQHVVETMLNALKEAL